MYKRRRKEGMYKIVSSPWLDLLGKAEDYRRNDLNCFKDTINIFFGFGLFHKFRDGLVLQLRNLFQVVMFIVL
jgi:hypothetical protein